MPPARQAATTRALLIQSAGILVGAVFLLSTVASSGDKQGTKDMFLRSSGTRNRVEETSLEDDDTHTTACRVLSHMSLPQDGVPSPSESALRFAAANAAGSDKVSLHSYHLMYGPFLAPYLPKNVSLLEIGVFDGASLTLWGNLFPNHGNLLLVRTLATEMIVGLGYGVGDAVAQGFKREITSKLSLYTGDQSDKRFLEQMKADLGHKQFDVIVDDGSHVPWHQLFTFEIMFESWLKPGGMYIIEDVETSYWDGRNPKIYGYDIINTGLGKKGSAVEKFKWIIDVLNRKFIDTDPAFSIFKSKVDHLVSHIAFSENCIILWKRSTPGLEDEWERAAKNDAAFSRKRKPGVLRKFSRNMHHQDELPRGKRGILSGMATRLRVFLFS